MNMNDVFSLAYSNYYRLTFNQYKHCWDVILFNTGASCVCVCSHAHASVLLYKYMYTFMTIHVWSRWQCRCHAICLFLETRSLAELVICWAGQAGWPVSLSESTHLCFLSAGGLQMHSTHAWHFYVGSWIEFKSLCLINRAISSPPPMYQISVPNNILRVQHMIFGSSGSICTTPLYSGSDRIV